MDNRQIRDKLHHRLHSLLLSTSLQHNTTADCVVTEVGKKRKKESVRIVRPPVCQTKRQVSEAALSDRFSQEWKNLQNLILFNKQVSKMAMPKKLQT